MSRIHAHVGRGIMVVSLILAGTGIAAAEGLPGTTLYAAGSEVWVRFISYDARYNSDLYFYLFAGAPEGQLLFRNQPAFPGDPAAASPGQTFRIDHAFRPAEEVIFGLFVRNTGQMFYSGDPARNDDGTLHGRTLPGSGDSRWVRLGFEDLTNGGDRDYNDVIVEVGGATTTVTPEPITLLLLGSGLAGVGGLGALRRRRHEDSV